MKISITAILFMTLFFALHSHAQHGEHEHNHNHEGQVVEPSAASNDMENAACEDTINIKVSGLVCDLTMQRLRSLSRTPGTT